MSHTNDTTVQSYDAHVQEYIDGTPQSVEGFVQDWIDRTLSGVPPSANILEIGSAFGRDADYIERLAIRLIGRMLYPDLRIFYGSRGAKRGF
jgi:hypothetical protein